MDCKFCAVAGETCGDGLDRDLADNETGDGTEAGESGEEEEDGLGEGDNVGEGDNTTEEDGLGEGDDSSISISSSNSVSPLDSNPSSFEKRTKCNRPVDTNEMNITTIMFLLKKVVRNPIRKKNIQKT